MADLGTPLVLVLPYSKEISKRASVESDTYTDHTCCVLNQT
jgi:hypothetical protein